MSKAGAAQIEIDYLRAELAKAKEQLNNEVKARAVLRSKGYFVDNLWHVDDVMSLYHCSKEKAYDVLQRALVNEGTKEQIHISIDDACDSLAINKKTDDD